MIRIVLWDKNLSSLQTKVNAEMHSIELWLRKNKLSLNYKKLIIAHKPPTP